MTEGIRRIYRSRSERRIAGVCAGIGLFFRIDPVLVRLLWVAVTFVTGVIPGVLAYLAAWIIVPDEPVQTRSPEGAAQPHQGHA